MPSVVCNITLRAEGAQPRQLAPTPPASLQCDWLHEVALTVPAAEGRAYGKSSYSLQIPGVAKFAVICLEGRATGSVEVNVKGKGPFDVSGTRIYLDQDATEIVSGLAEVKLTNSSSMARTISIVAGVDFPAEDDSAALKTPKKKASKKKASKKKASKKKTAKKGTSRARR